MPPFAHGYDVHSARFSVPAQLNTHTHENWNRHAAHVHKPSTLVESFMHGDDLHSWIDERVLPPSAVS